MCVTLSKCFFNIWGRFPRTGILPALCDFKKKVFGTAVAKPDRLGHFLNCSELKTLLS